MRRNLDISLLDDCIRMLAASQTLAPEYYDHSLAGQWSGYRECHIQPDWILVYRVESDELVLVLSRTGKHSDLGF
ncbi:MAG: type II toxin-antitoxin system YafQ family toxin [Clostridiales Family XIII bacterium]|nr:type II toxin-antitoxin system YafQ family toxin [Clostridiales Family XIII bacterium]